MTRKYIIVADDSINGFDEEIAKLEREWGAEEIEPCEDCISRTELLARIDAEREHLLNIKMDGAEHIVVHHARRIIEDMTSVTPTTRWIPVSERLPSHDEYIKNNEMFIVSDGNRSYFGWFDFYDTKKFVKPTIAGFCVDNAVIAWMPLPEPYKESEDKE